MSTGGVASCSHPVVTRTCREKLSGEKNQSAQPAELAGGNPQASKQAFVQRGISGHAKKYLMVVSSARETFVHKITGTRGRPQLGKVKS